MAVNLARSFLHWHPNTNIKFQLVTDLPNYVPVDIAHKIQIISIKPGEFGLGFSPKLHLDELASPGKTLFIDSDCLIFGNIEFIFKRFIGHGVSVVGGYIGNGDWFGDITAICRKFNVAQIPKFNGGIYYLEKGNIATKVYDTARELEKRYDEIGFVRLRNRPNDEVIMALAMQLNKQTPINDDGMIMSDPQACPGGHKVDVITGKRWLLNPPSPHPLHQNWYPFEKVSPSVIHFLGPYTQSYSYKKEVYRLKQEAQKKLTFVSEVIAVVTIQYPEQLKAGLKTLLRPFYQQVFGNRKIKRSERIV